MKSLGRGLNGSWISLGLVLVLASMSLSGCIFGPRRTFASTVIPVKYVVGGDKVVVAVQDKREYVVSGESAPAYIGQSRGKWGIPYSRNTSSGRPLAQDMGKSMCASLKKAGFQTVQVLTQPKDSSAAVVGSMRQGEAPRMLLLTIKEWMYDIYGNRSFNMSYHLVLQVLDDLGNIRGQASVSYDGQVSKNSRVIFQEQMTKLLNHPEIEGNVH